MKVLTLGPLTAAAAPIASPFTKGDERVNKQELILAILEKQEQIEQLETKIRAQNGRIVMTRITCRDIKPPRKLRKSYTMSYREIRIWQSRV